MPSEPIFERVPDDDILIWEVVDDDVVVPGSLLGDSDLRHGQLTEGFTASISAKTRIDPDDEQVHSLEELHAKYGGQYSREDILTYWLNDCWEDRRGQPLWSENPCSAVAFVRDAWAHARQSLCLLSSRPPHHASSVKCQVLHAASGESSPCAQLARRIAELMGDDLAFVGRDLAEAEGVVAQVLGKDGAWDTSNDLLVNALVCRVEQRLNDIAMQVGRVGVPDEPLQLVEVSSAVLLPWAEMPHVPADPDQGQAWDSAYSQIHVSRPIWLVERPRVEIRRLVEERWLDVSGRVLALDLGCGLGHDALCLAQAGFHACGLDLSVGAIERATAEALAQGLGGRAQFFACDAYELPVPTEPLALICDNTLLARAVCDPGTPQTIREYREMLVRLSCPGSLVFLQVVAEELAEKQHELRERGIHLPRISAKLLALEFACDFDFMFIRKGVYEFGHAFCRAAADVGWREPGEIGGHPGWCVLMRRKERRAN